MHARGVGVGEGHLLSRHDRHNTWAEVGVDDVLHTMKMSMLLRHLWRVAGTVRRELCKKSSIPLFLPLPGQSCAEGSPQLLPRIKAGGRGHSWELHKRQSGKLRPNALPLG